MAENKFMTGDVVACIDDSGISSAKPMLRNGTCYVIKNIDENLVTITDLTGEDVKWTSGHPFYYDTRFELISRFDRSDHNKGKNNWGLF